MLDGWSQLFLDGATSFVTLSYDASGVAPHALTQRASYIVPAHRSAFMVYTGMSILQQSAPTTVGIADIYCQYTPSGGNATHICECPKKTASVGSQLTRDFSGALPLRAGDHLEIYTSDASTGGTISYDGHIIVIEFNA